MFIAEWVENGKHFHKIFDSEVLATEFANFAYLDCLVVVSIRPLTPPEMVSDLEYEHFMADISKALTH